jgi:hypothetical protein
MTPPPLTPWCIGGGMVGRPFPGQGTGLCPICCKKVAILGPKHLVVRHKEKR